MNILYKHIDSIKELSATSDVIGTITATLNKDFADIGPYTEDAVLSNIFQLHIESGSTKLFYASFTGNLSNFYKSKNKIIWIRKEGAKENFLKLMNCAMQKHNIDLTSLKAGLSGSVVNSIENLAQAKKLTELEVATVLYRDADICIVNNNFINKVSSHMEQPEISNEKDLNALLNKQREANSVDLSHINDAYNLYLLNDGTGSGKTHNVVMNFIHQFKNTNSNEVMPRKSLVFMAPQKNQLFATSSVFLEAEKSKIPLLFARSKNDLTDLESKNFLQLNKETNEFQTVSDCFESMFDKFNAEPKNKINKILKEGYVEECVDSDEWEQEDTDKENKKSLTVEQLLNVYNTYLHYEGTHKAEQIYAPEQYKDGFESARRSFFRSLVDVSSMLAKGTRDEILNKIFKWFADNDPMASQKEFGKDYRTYKFIYDIITYTMPFEAAKYINCIIYMTGDKSQYTFLISELKKGWQCKKTVKNYSFDDLLSGYSVSSSADVLKHANDSDLDFGEFLDREYFIKNDRNYFAKNNIGFSVVYDEEHILYNKFTEDYTFRPITEKAYGSTVNIIHALASLNRWLKNISVKNELMNVGRLHEEKQKIVRKLFDEIKNHTSFKTDADFENFLEAVESNEFGILVKSTDYEFIRALCENVIAYSPKLIMSQEYLKNINLNSERGSPQIVISKNNSNLIDIQNPSQPGSVSEGESPEVIEPKSNANGVDINNSLQTVSVLDLLQVILTILYVCKDSSSIVGGRLEKGRENNHQNMALYHLFKIANDSRAFLENLFSSSLDMKEDDNISVQFAYFLTKIGFNFKFITEVETRDFVSEYMRVEPHVFIINELPEVNMLQILKNPLNKVFLLSATRGFKKIFSGNYSDLFFKKVNCYLPGTLKIFQREMFENNPMPKFTESRFKKRSSVKVNKIIFNCHRTKNNPVKDTVSLLSYKVTNVDAAGIGLKNDLVACNESYQLIKSGGRNFLEDIIDNVNQSDYFKNNVYGAIRREEVLRVFKCIVHAYENGENAMIMTLTNRFKELMRHEVFRESIFSGIKTIGSPDSENKFKVIEYHPKEKGTGKKIRLICFDAELGRTTDLKEHFVSDPDTLIILVSSYISAGTGLNLTIEERSGGKSSSEKDFDAIYFVSGPYYTSVKNKKEYDHISNQLLIFKSLAHEGGKTVANLSDGLSSIRSRKILKQEHKAEQAKTIMQAIGRIERRDSEMDTKIYFVDEEGKTHFDECMFGFNELYGLHGHQSEKTIIANFSMLAKSLLKVALNHTEKYSMPIASRKVLENESKIASEAYCHFFESMLPNALSAYRKGNKDYFWFRELNEIFRAYVDPNYSYKTNLISFIKKNGVALKNCSYYQAISNLIKYAEFDFVSHGVPQNKSVTIDYSNMCFSDCSKNNKIVTDNVLFGYGQESLSVRISAENNFIKKMAQKHKYGSSLSKLPNFYLTHLIRGNIAEDVLKDYFTDKGIIFNDLKNIFGAPVDMKMYELFDFYVVKDNIIYAIDTKNWNLYNDSGASKLLMKFEDKIKKIKNIPEFAGYLFRFIYLNMSPSIKSNLTSGLSSHFGAFRDVSYMNFISYVPGIIEEKDKKNKKNMTKWQVEQKTYEISKEWRDLI